MYLEADAGLQPHPGLHVPLEIAVIGSGIAGLSAAWLLSKRHRVTLYEADHRIGGHSHTRNVAGTPVDTGFIVYNEQTYPNLTALLRHLNVPTRATEMSFGVSLDHGRVEYSGSGLRGLLAQKRNLLRPRFWGMCRDLLRFYREASGDQTVSDDESLNDYLDRCGYGAAFREDHLYPMAAAIWSTPSIGIRDYPAAAFIKFCQNHALLQFGKRPPWRTVLGGSREYVERMLADFHGTVLTGTPVRQVVRHAYGADVVTDLDSRRFDQVVIAAHADQALAMLDAPDAEETRLLGAFGYCHNTAVLHSDPAQMPHCRKVWSAWNFMRDRPHGDNVSVTYWMNALQELGQSQPLFVTLNPARGPDPAKVHWEGDYSHPVFDGAALRAQRRLWTLQGRNNTWYCGAYFGAGFHEDGLQAGLAVGELLGGAARPWHVADPSGRIHVGASTAGALAP